MITLGESSELNLAVYTGPGSPLPKGWKEMSVVVDPDTGLTMGHYANGARNYLAVRGTWDASDMLPALRVFFGADPVDRIKVAQKHVSKLFGPHPKPVTLAVGGHSLGGLIAAAVAERFDLPGLAQNSPGWMTRVPDASRLGKFIQVRTARDVVADWGNHYPRNLMLPDPDLPMWNLSSLHNLEHQNELIREYGLAERRVDNPALGVWAHEGLPPSPDGQWARLSRAVDRWRAGREYTQLHQHLAQSSPKPGSPGLG